MATLATFSPRGDAEAEETGGGGGRRDRRVAGGVERVGSGAEILYLLTQKWFEEILPETLFTAKECIF